MTSNEQKQQFSVAYVHAVSARAGYACQVQTVDLDSVDLTISAVGMVHETSVLRSPRVDVQLKATASFSLHADELRFPLPLKNDNDLRHDSAVAKLLIVLTLPKTLDAWIDHDEERMILRRCAYWTSLSAAPEVANSTNVTVSLRRSRRFTVDQLQEIMRCISRGESL